MNFASVIIDFNLLPLVEVLAWFEDPRFSVQTVWGKLVPQLVSDDVRLRHRVAEPSRAHVLVEEAFVPDLSVVHYVVVEDPPTPEHTLQRA